MRDETYTGLWWLPGNPDTRLAGTLETSVTKRPSLSLVGSLAPVERMADRNDYPIVHGFSDRGKRITLMHAQTRTSKFSAPGFPTQELVASVALIGGHFATPESVTATVSYAEFTHLTDWLGPGAYQDTHDADLDRVGIQYTMRHLPTVKIGDSNVAITTGFRVRGDALHERAIEATSSVRVTWARPLHEVIDQRVAPFQNLLTLGTDLPNRITNLQFRSDQADKNRDEDLIDAIFPVADPPPPPRPTIIYDMLFAYPRVEDVFPRLLEGWYEVHDSLKDVCALYFAVRRRLPLPLEVEFLTLVRALEVFDRARNGNSVRPRSEHRAYVRSLVEAVDAVDRAWLKEKLAFSNEPSLRERLSRLLTDVGDTIDPIAGDRDLFARRVTDTRNYYTHYAQSLRNKAATGKELFWLNERLSTFLAALLLRAAHLDPERVSTLFRENQSYVWLMRVNAGLED